MVKRKLKSTSRSSSISLAKARTAGLRLSRKAFFLLLVVGGIVAHLNLLCRFQLEKKDGFALQDQLRHSTRQVGYDVAGMERIEVSVVILTCQKHGALAKLLPSVAQQKPKNFEVIIADNGCLPETSDVVTSALYNATSMASVIPYKHLRSCGNQGHSIGNDKGVQVSQVSSGWVLFLNDDVVLQGDDFIQSVLNLGRAKSKAAAVGCKMLAGDGSHMIESGSIIWKEGLTDGFGRGRPEIDAPQFNYARPVDCVSGTCLMVKKQLFINYGGFDHRRHSAYCEDTDLQMHLQHDLGKEVWLQPAAVAFHDEHGSFGNKAAMENMQAGKKVFFSRWKDALLEHHLPYPNMRGISRKKQKKTSQGEKILIQEEFMKFEASDLRARSLSSANMLCIDQNVPNKAMGAGFGRSFDNLSMLADLGHRITMVPALKTEESFCDLKCRREIQDLGVEVITNAFKEFTAEKEFLWREGFYDVVIVSRPSTFHCVKDSLRQMHSKRPFVLICDCEALWHRRDAMLADLVKTMELPSSSGGKAFSIIDFLGSDPEEQRENELKLVSMADIVIAVSDSEKEVIHSFFPDSDARSIGHVVEVHQVTSRSFHERNGILFLASFQGMMCYNGDAIWCFLQKVCPLIVEESHSNPPRLTIAGRGIPDELRKSAESDTSISPYVSFIESPLTVDSLCESARVVVAPHLHGAGIQHKVNVFGSMA